MTSETAQVINLAGHKVSLHTSGVADDKSLWGTLYIVGNPIIAEGTLGGGVTQCWLGDIRESISQPPDKKWILHDDHDGVDPQQGIRIFTNYEDGFSRIASWTSGKIIPTRHGIPLVKVRVSQETLWKWNAQPLPSGKPGFWIPYFNPSEVEIKTAEFKGAYFAPFRAGSVGCVIL